MRPGDLLGIESEMRKGKGKKRCDQTKKGKTEKVPTRGWKRSAVPTPGLAVKSRGESVLYKAESRPFMLSGVIRKPSMTVGGPKPVTTRRAKLNPESCTGWYRGGCGCRRLANDWLLRMVGLKICKVLQRGLSLAIGCWSKAMVGLRNVRGRMKEAHQEMPTR